MSKEAQIALSSQENTGVSTLSRRQFLKGAALLGGALVLNQVLPASQAEAQTVEPSTPKPNSQPLPTNEPQAQVVNDKPSEQEPSLLNTAKESVYISSIETKYILSGNLC